MAANVRSAADAKPLTYTAPALEKGVDVLELLATEPGGLTISEIAQRLGRSISELFRVIVVLDRRGWLCKDAVGDRYRVTYRLLAVAHRATPAQELTHAATPSMHALAAATMQSCHLAVVNGRRALIVARQESPGPTGFAVRLGTDIDLLTSCSGHVLLAFLEEGRRATLFPDGLPGSLVARLETVRAQGYESMPSSRMADVSDLSCPIFGFDGHVVAALTVPFINAIGDEPHVSVPEALVALKQAATAISVALGWSDRAEARSPAPAAQNDVAAPSRRRGRAKAT